jgi:apolipoprotein N-acyltransferase
VVAEGLLLPLAAGAACVAGFAPFYAWLIPIAAIGILFHVWTHSGTPLQAALSGYAFGLGYFLAGVSWVYVSLHDYGAMPAPLAGLATFAFCAYLALFFAAAGWLARRLAATPGRRLALAAASVVLFEWLRGWLFTGFPWLTLGTSQAPGSPLAGLAPVLGAYGVSLAVVATAAMLVAIARREARSRARAFLAIGIVALFAVGAAGRSVEWTEPAGEALEFALLQGNVAQELKWQEDLRPAILEAHRRMILSAPARIVVTPETALPALLDQLPADYLADLRAGARSQGKEILLGTVERNPRGGEVDYYNSVVSLTGEGSASYRKRHLVPFGEYIPPGFAWILAVLHIPMSDFARGPDRQRALYAAGVPLGIAICYEDIFGEEVIDALPEAQVLVNVSNDAWFGRSFAAEQHLQASQMRAIETGRWMVRSTNTGATAAIDPTGRVVSRLPVFTSGTLVQKVQPMKGLTPYARWGNWAAVTLAAALALLAWRRR